MHVRDDDGGGSVQRLVAGHSLGAHNAQSENTTGRIFDDILFALAGSFANCGTCVLSCLIARQSYEMGYSEMQ